MRAVVAVVVAVSSVVQDVPPPLPPGTRRIVSFDRQGTLVAMCVEGTGPALERNARRIPLTDVWIHDGQKTWKTAVGTAACDPALSPDGRSLAVISIEGLWVLSGNTFDQARRIVDARTPARPANEFDYVAFSKPQWSPDGTRIAYLATNGGVYWVEMVDAAGARRLFKSEPGPEDFTWGRDSRSLKIGDGIVKLP